MSGLKWCPKHAHKFADSCIWGDADALRAYGNARLEEAATELGGRFMAHAAEVVRSIKENE